MHVFWMTVSVGLCTLGGVFASDRLHSRCVILDDMQMVCRTVRIQSACQRTAIGQILLQTEPSSPAVRQLLLSCCEALHQHPSNVAWEQALGQIYANRFALGITKQHLRLFHQMGECMNLFLEQQQRSLEHLEQTLALSAQQANEVWDRRGKLCVKLGLLFGIMGALLIG